MNTKKIFTFFLLFIINLTFAQNQNNNWRFGNQASINFNGGVVTSNSNNRMISIEACASVSDRVTGNTLFYSNGLQIWNKNNNLMPNGSGLLGGANTSSTQGVLIVPHPGNSLRYFLLTIDETFGGAINGFRYSIVDLSLDGGLGDVVANQKNILIQNNVAEKISYTKTNDGAGYWVVVHERDNDVFKAYQINQNGINLTPVITSLGSLHTTVNNGNGDGTMGCIKFNSTGTKLATTIYAASQVEIFDFDNCSGSIKNPITISTLDNPYGLEFSPDGSKLYYSLYYNIGFQGAVFQLNMNSANVANSATLIGISSSFNNQCVGALQLGPDNKIYIAINGESWLSAINKPNVLGAACEFVDKAITLIQFGLSPSPSYLGLPQPVLFTSGSSSGGSSSGSFSISANNFCFGNTTQLQIIPNTNIKKILWNFGDISSVNNTDTIISTTHLYSDTGSYNVIALIATQCKTDTAKTIIKINGKQKSTIDTTICKNQLPFLWNNNLYAASGNYSTIKKDRWGCDSLCTLNLFTKQCDTVININCNISIPNAFSPNGDGINDFFLPNITCVPQQYQITIFTRWGQQIFTSNNYKTKWLGTCNNKEVPIGVYYYIINTTLQNSQNKTFSGYITVIR